jgi:hypothetical protein
MMLSQAGCGNGFGNRIIDGVEYRQRLCAGGRHAGRCLTRIREGDISGAMLSVRPQLGYFPEQKKGGETVFPRMKLKTGISARQARVTPLTCPNGEKEFSFYLLHVRFIICTFAAANR